MSGRIPNFVSRTLSSGDEPRSCACLNRVPPRPQELGEGWTSELSQNRDLLEIDWGSRRVFSGRWGER